MLRVLCSLLSPVLLSCWLLGGGARAAEASSAGLSPATLAEAKRHFVRAAERFEQERYQDALGEFQASYQLSGKTDLLYNLHLCALRLGRTQDALRYLEEYLPTAADRDQHLGMLEALRQQVAQQQPAPPPPPPPPRWPPPPALGLAAGGFAVLATGIGLSGAAYAAARSLEGRYDPGLSQRGPALDMGGIALCVIGGAALAAGGGWIAVFLSERHHRKHGSL